MYAIGVQSSQAVTPLQRAHLDQGMLHIQAINARMAMQAILSHGG
jgi:hypothetical protein